MKTIPLTRGKFALVDDEDFEKVSAHKWYAQKARYGWTAARNRKGKPHIQYMHHLILGSTRRVDHKDRNPLNNQRDNIRLATPGQNNCNRPKWGIRSRFKGVTYDKRTPGHLKVWRVRIGGGRSRGTIGYFSSESDAAKAYDAAAVSAFGEFALTNKQLGLL